MNRALSLVALAAAWMAATSCYDDGAVGTVVPVTCEPACAPDETCDPMLNRCIECEGPACGETPDECDDCSAGDAACMAMYCRPCTTDAECMPDEPVCDDGFCAELDEDGP